MRVTQEIRNNLQLEIRTSQSAIDKAQQRLASWSGSARQVELITQVINQHWPRITFINLVLNKKSISNEELETINRGILTEVELREIRK